jgi:hypothetical protein
MSKKETIPSLAEPSGVPGANEGIFVTLELEMNDSGSSVGSGGVFDLALGQPSDESMTQSAGTSIPSFQHSSDTNSDDEESHHQASNGNHLAVEKKTSVEDSKPIATLAYTLSEDKTDDTMIRVAYGVPYPVFSGNPLPTNRSERDAMWADIGRDKKKKEEHAEKQCELRRSQIQSGAYIEELRAQNEVWRSWKKQRVSDGGRSEPTSETSLSSAYTTPEKEATPDKEANKPSIDVVVSCMVGCCVLFVVCFWPTVVSRRVRACIFLGFLKQ